ncbi:serine/threonine-protein kinase [Nocardia sp. NPDC051756]|uniref:serine/threonine-protein kinase n=1 Tax=Nocardia sp. NPDC051756 TaxID=3154751 RepID=UPI0034203D71
MTESVAPGSVFAGYLIERVLGAGGMGSVYLARHPRLPRWDALKVLSEMHSGDTEFQARFLREAELAARLEHPNVVAVHDRGVHNGRLWIAMQFVDGIDAAELVRRGAPELSPERVVHIIDGAARGLDEAHRAGVLHRDVKPANIMLESRPGEPDRVFVTDFGIARAAGQTTALTEVGSVLATLAYAAPEQLMGAAVDHRADVYALGCTLYELLTGSKPYPRTSAVAVMQAHLHDPPPRPSAANPALPQAMDGVLARALAKNPDDRYSSCGGLAGAARAALYGSVDTPTQRAPRPSRKRRVRFAAAGLAVAVVVAIAVATVVVLQGNSADPRPATAAPVSSTTTTPATTGATPQSWANYNFVVQAFPEFLPSSPFSTGYQGLRCAALDLENRQVDVNLPAPPLATLICHGNGAPVDYVDVSCRASRAPAYPRPFPQTVLVGEQRWERPSGRGRVILENDTDGKGQPQGLLQIEFESPLRNFCYLAVWGNSSGQDLYDRWWPGAPF